MAHALSIYSRPQVVHAAAFLMEERVMRLMSVMTKVFVSTASNPITPSAAQKRMSATKMTTAVVPAALAVSTLLIPKATLVLVHRQEVLAIPLIPVMAKENAWIDFSAILLYAGEQRMIAMLQRCVTARVVNVHRIYFNHQELPAAAICLIINPAMHRIPVMPMAIAKINIYPKQLFAETKLTLAIMTSIVLAAVVYVLLMFLFRDANLVLRSMIVHRNLDHVKWHNAFLASAHMSMPPLVRNVLVILREVHAIMTQATVVTRMDNARMHSSRLLLHVVLR